MKKSLYILFTKDIIPNVFGTFLGNVETKFGYDAAFYIYCVLHNLQRCQNN